MPKHKVQQVKKLKTLDLYAGVGGIKLGFEAAGFDTALSVDIDPYCKITFDHAFRASGEELELQDVGHFADHPEELPQFEVLTAGFPCQPFSIAGYRKGFEDQERGNQFSNILRIIKAKEPIAFLLENVKNLRGHDKGNTFNVIVKSLESAGYVVSDKVMNSMNYGNLPQNRERVYIVGFRDANHSSRFSWPEPIPLKKGVLDILDLEVDNKYYYQGSPLFDRLVTGVVKRGVVYQWRRQYVRENKSGVCPTLTANMGMGGHNVPIVLDPIGIRKLTPDECFRLQGFPKRYRLPHGVADSRLYKQAGNSVTVPVISRIAESMFVAISGIIT